MQQVVYVANIVETVVVVVCRNASTVCVRVCYGESLLVPGGCHWLVAGAWWVGEFGATVHGVVVEMLVRSV